jgi:hypothetical protein
MLFINAKEEEAKADGERLVWAISSEKTRAYRNEEPMRLIKSARRRGVGCPGIG